MIGGCNSQANSPRRSYIHDATLGIPNFFEEKEMKSRKRGKKEQGEEKKEEKSKNKKRRYRDT